MLVEVTGLLLIASGGERTPENRSHMPTAVGRVVARALIEVAERAAAQVSIASYSKPTIPLTVVR